MRNKNENSGAPMITADRLVSIPNYVPNPSEMRFYVLSSNDVTIFKQFDPKNPKTAARALYAIGKIPMTDETESFIATYGNRVILVSKQFLKMRKKTQTMLIEKACFAAAGVPERFINGTAEIDSTNMDRHIAAELQMMEKYGYGKIKRLMKKEQAFNMSAIKKAGTFLFKSHKKEQKMIAKQSKTTNSQKVNVEELRKPITFSNTEAAAI